MQQTNVTADRPNPFNASQRETWSRQPGSQPCREILDTSEALGYDLATKWHVFRVFVREWVGWGISSSYKQWTRVKEEPATIILPIIQQRTSLFSKNLLQRLKSVKNLSQSLFMLAHHLTPKQASFILSLRPWKPCSPSLPLQPHWSP